MNDHSRRRARAYAREAPSGLLGYAFVALCLAFCGLGLPQIAVATPEAICPGGASPRSDVAWCVGFDTLGQCTTGQEAGCVSDNGVSSLSVNNATKDFKIKTCPKTSPITTSTGCIYGSGEASGTGPGYSNKTYTGVTSACVRYYVLFGDGYLQNVSDTGNHGPGLLYSDGSSCSGKITIDFTLTALRAIHQADSTASCAATAPAGQNIAITGTQWTPKNNQWYRVEMCSTMNTTASSGTAGNGTLTLKVDGVTAISRTDLNIRGGTGETATYSDAYLARSYQGLGTPNWEPNIYFAGFAFSNNGTELGASANEATIAAGDSSSPYWYTVAGNGAEQQKLALDCSAPGSTSKYVTLGWDDPWSGSPTYVTTPDHNTYACKASCSGSCVTTNSMKAQTTGANTRAGNSHYVSNLNSTINNTAVIHSWVYLDSANDYTAEVPILGFARYCAGGGGGNDRCVAGIARNSSGKLVVVIYTDNVKGTTITTTTDLLTDTWTELQFAIKKDNTVYAQKDGTWVVDGSTPSQAVGTWAFDAASSGQQFVVYGVMRDSPATNFNVYYDDMDAGAASFNDTKFWGSSSPFSTASTGTTTGNCVYNLLRRRNQ